MRRRLVDSREQAREAIDAGRVTVGGAPALKPARMVAPDEPVELLGPPPRFVGRGGAKLDAALDRFTVDVEGARVLDAGASTGGFTDCLLQRGAREVVAVDVGHGQLHQRLRSDPRVRVLERTNIREVTTELIGDFDVIVGDLSFISLRTVLPSLTAVARPGCHLVLLVKPQFEAGRKAADRGRGVITDPEVWRGAILGVIDALRSHGATMMGVMVSPVRGASGNVEFLVHARMSAPASPGDAVDRRIREWVDGAVDAAVRLGRL